MAKEVIFEIKLERVGVWLKVSKQVYRKWPGKRRKNGIETRKASKALRSIV